MEPRVKINGRLTLAVLFAAAVFLGTLETRTFWSLWRGKPLDFVSHSGKVRDRVFYSVGPQYDPIKGYRTPHGKVRITRFHNDEILFDNVIFGNQQGFPSKNDFVAEKSPSVYRIVIFGDSQTAGVYLKAPWPKVVEQAFNASGKSTQLEIYSYAMEGMGASNWKEIYFHEIAGKIDFDGLLVASCSDSVHWDFLAGDSQGKTLLLGRSADASQLQGLSQAQLPKILSPVDSSEIRSDEAIDTLLASLKREPLPPFRPYATRQLRAKTMAGVRQIQIIQSFTSVPINAERDPAKTSDTSVRSILEDVQKRKKDLYLVSVPMRSDLNKGASEQEMLSRNELKRLSREFQVPFFDGQERFKMNRITDTTPRIWLAHDSHWDQAGSDLFAKEMAGFLTAHIP